MADNYIVLYPKYIAKIDAHAHSHYEQWDEWVECLDTEDKLKIIAGTTTYEQALRKAAEWVKVRLEIQGIHAENCALYDTGEQEYDDYYTEIQANTELDVDALMETSINIRRKHKEIYG